MNEDAKSKLAEAKALIDEALSMLDSEESGEEESAPEMSKSPAQDAGDKIKAASAAIRNRLAK